MATPSTVPRRFSLALDSAQSLTLLVVVIISLSLSEQSTESDERLIYGAKTDSVDLMQEVLNGSEPYDINHQDGLGNTGESPLSLSRVDRGGGASGSCRTSGGELCDKRASEYGGTV